MSLWTDIRDTAESAVVLGGNYVLPGSAAITSKLTSQGSQDQLNSTLGKYLQLGTGGAGAYSGNLANYGTAYDKLTNAFGGAAGSQVTGQQAVDAFNSGKISAAEFEALAQGAGTTGAGLLAGGAALSQYLTPAAILGSSLIGANAASSAGAAQAAATDRANQIAYQMFKEQQALQQPYVQAGTTAQNRLLTLLGLDIPTPTASTPKTGSWVDAITSQFDSAAAKDAVAAAKASPDFGKYTKDFSMADFQADPGYQFRLDEGLKSLDRQAAARGGLISGGALKAAQSFGQKEASQEYTNAFNRYQTNRTNQLQPLGNLVASGQSAASNAGSAAANYGTTAGNNITSGAAAQAAGQIGAANALTGGVSQYLSYDTNNNLLNLLAKQRQSSYTG